VSGTIIKAHRDHRRRPCGFRPIPADGARRAGRDGPECTLALWAKVGLRV